MICPASTPSICSDRVHLPHKVTLLIVLLLDGVGSVEAQRIPGSPPSDHECRVAANKLGSDPHSQAFRDALEYGPLAGCGEIGGRALADALRRTRTLSDTSVLTWLGAEAWQMRSPHVFEAALEVAGDRAASVPARASSLLVLLGQEKEGALLDAPWQQNLVVPVGRFCGVRTSSHFEYHSEAPLPADHRARVEGLLSRIMEDKGEPILLRELAHCIHRVLTLSRSLWIP